MSGGRQNNQKNPLWVLINSVQPEKDYSKERKSESVTFNFRGAKQTVLSCWQSKTTEQEEVQSVESLTSEIEKYTNVTDFKARSFEHYVLLAREYLRLYLNKDGRKEKVFRTTVEPASAKDILSNQLRDKVVAVRDCHSEPNFARYWNFNNPAADFLFELEEKILKETVHDVANIVIGINSDYAEGVRKDSKEETETDMQLTEEQLAIQRGVFDANAYYKSISSQSIIFKAKKQFYELLSRDVTNQKYFKENNKGAFLQKIAEEVKCHLRAKMIADNDSLTQGERKELAELDRYTYKDLMRHKRKFSLRESHGLTHLKNILAQESVQQQNFAYYQRQLDKVVAQLDNFMQTDIVTKVIKGKGGASTSTAACVLKEGSIAMDSPIHEKINAILFHPNRAPTRSDFILCAKVHFLNAKNEHPNEDPNDLFTKIVGGTQAIFQCFHERSWQDPDRTRLLQEYSEAIFGVKGQAEARGLVRDSYRALLALGRGMGRNSFFPGMFGGKSSQGIATAASLAMTDENNLGRESILSSTGSVRSERSYY